MEAGGSDGEMDGFGVAVSREAMGKLAESGDRETIYQAGDTIGAYLAGLGFNVDFAPDADVLADAENQAIGDRSFGTDPQVVASMAWAFAEALHHNGILAAYKHFPGHGGRRRIPIRDMPMCTRHWRSCGRRSWFPFRTDATGGVDFIMVSHISGPGGHRQQRAGHSVRKSGGGFAEGGNGI